MRVVFSSAPRESFRLLAPSRCRERNFEEIEGYHGGTSSVGRDEERVDSERFALDGRFWFEYDSRLSRKRDSEQD